MTPETIACRTCAGPFRPMVPAQVNCRGCLAKRWGRCPGCNDRRTYRLSEAQPPPYCQPCKRLRERRALIAHDGGCEVIARRFVQVTRRRLRIQGAPVETVASVPEIIAILREPDCVYCGEPAATLDHVRSIAWGGDGSAANTVPACWTCNSGKTGWSLL